MVFKTRYNGMMRRERLKRLICFSALFVVIYWLYWIMPLVNEPTDSTFQLRSVALNGELTRVAKEHCNIYDTNVTNACLIAMQAYDARLKANKTHLDKDDCSECLTMTNGRSQKERLIIYYHTFWQIDSRDEVQDDFNFRVMKMNIASYLSTQNLCCTRFILWKLAIFPDWFERQLKLIFADYFRRSIINIRTFDLVELCNNNESSFRGSEVCLEANLKVLTSGGGSNSDLVKLSDLVRFAVLDLYGGIYTDGDVLYLKSLRSLWEYNFTYRWSDWYIVNTAVLGINRALQPADTSSLYRKLLRPLNRMSFLSIMRRTLFGNSFSFKYLTYMFHPARVTELILAKTAKFSLEFETLTVFNSLLFDPSWLCDDRHPRILPHYVCKFKEFTGRVLFNDTASSFRPENFFAGAFTYHLHSSSGPKAIEGSYFDLFEKYYESHFPNMRKNLTLDVSK